MLAIGVEPGSSTTALAPPVSPGGGGHLWLYAGGLIIAHMSIYGNNHYLSNLHLWLYAEGRFGYIDAVYVSNVALIKLNRSTGHILPREGVEAGITPASPTSHLPGLFGAMYGTDGIVTSIARLSDTVVAIGGIFTRFGGLPCAGLCYWDSGRCLKRV